MIHTVEFLFATADMLPRGACMAWRPSFVWMFTISDAVSAFACLSIPAAILAFLRRRRDLEPEARLFAYLIIAFILAAFFTHLGQLVTLWVPAYSAQAVIKAATATISLAAAIAVWPQLPKLLRLPSPRDLRQANAALVQANASLETTIAWRTYELEQSKARFEMALSRSNITVFTQDLGLRYTWIHNPRLGLRAEDTIGRTSEEVLPDEAASQATELKRRVLASGHTVSDTISVQSPSEGIIYLDMTVSPTVDRSGVIDGVLCTAVDVTEKRLFEVRLASMAGQLADAFRRFELALEDSPITVFEQDAELRYTFVQNPPAGTTAADYLGRTDADIYPEADQRRIVPAKRRVLETSQRETLEVELTVAGERKYYDLRLEPRTGPDGETAGVIGTAVDQTERRRNENQMRIVMRELTHRSKNLLAVIQAMARKTASLSPDMESFVADFSSRLRAMAAAQDVLVAHSWSGADIDELLTVSLAPTVDPSSPQIRMEGPPLKLAPDTAQNLALAFHELTTNAAKHGALSVNGGRVSIDWSRSEGQVTIHWREEGGPPVAPPEHRGFGRVLLERLVGATLGGAVTLEFRPEGLACEISFPEDRLSAD
jgi:PAS domain S-box-containing protein